MPIHLAKETFKNLTRLTELNAVIKCNKESSPEFISAVEEYLNLKNPIVEDFEPIIQKLISAGLLVANIDDEKGCFIPNYQHVEFEVSNVFNNGNLWLVARSQDCCGSSLRRHRPGTEPRLYTWNNKDGIEGEPSRPISIYTGKYLLKAFLAGGPGWHKNSKKGSILVIAFTSNKKGESQDVDQQEFYFKHYKSYLMHECYASLGHKLIKIETLDAGPAAWTYEIALGKGENKGQKYRNVITDNLIHSICEHHNKEMRRLRRKWSQKCNGCC